MEGHIVFYDGFINICRHEGVSPTRVLTTLNISKGSLSRWRNGGSPTNETKKKIADYLQISIAELEAGKIEKPIANESDERNKVKLPSNVFPAPKMRPIPIVGTIRAGVPIFAEENIEGYEYDDVPEGEDCFFLRVKGDSMVNARICDGDLVLIKRQPCADDGQIVACIVNGDEATLKRFYQQGNMVILKPENPAYNPILVPCADFDSGYARIIGVVIKVEFKL